MIKLASAKTNDNKMNIDDDIYEESDYGLDDDSYTLSNDENESGCKSQGTQSK